MNRRTASQILAYVVLLGMVGLAVFQSDVRRALLEVSSADVVVLLGVALLGIVALGLQFRAAVAVLGANVTMPEWLGLTSLNTLANLLIPARAGLAIRALYLKTTYNMSVTAYIGFTAVSLGFVILLASVTGAVSSYLLLPIESQTTGVITFSLIAAAVTLAAGLTLSARVPDIRFVRRLRGLQASVRPFVSISRNTTMVVVWSVVFFCIQAGGTYVAFRAAGARVSVLDALLIHSASTVSFLLAITPGGLGIREGVVVFVSAAIGVSPDLGLAAALIDRAASLAVTTLVTMTIGRNLLPIALGGKKPERPNH